MKINVEINLTPKEPMICLNCRNIHEQGKWLQLVKLDTEKGTGAATLYVCPTCETMGQSRFLP